MLSLILAAILPAVEMEMARVVAHEYQLNREQTALLIAIRKFENGRPGLEFGVGGPMDSGHPAHKYTDGIKSFLCQARWAAGTIRRRYTGDLAAFARRYCPYHAKKWEEGVRRNLIKALKEVR